MTLQYESRPATQRIGFLSKIISYLKSHPLLFLILLTPGIPEYLSASSSLTVLVINPPVFLLLLGANIGLYGSGVILIREAMIRWNRGWPTVFFLGAAYGIVEEGLALRTLFNPASPVVGTLGSYGHWLGVNWVWTVGLLIFHSIYSIGLPIFLFGLVFPDLKRKSLVANEGLLLCGMSLFWDSLLLSLVVNYWPGWPLILFSSLVISLFVLTGKKLPRDFLKSSLDRPKWRPFSFALIGASLFPATLFTGGISAGANAPPILPSLLDILFTILIVTRAFRSMGSRNNQEQKVAFAIGLLSPIAVFGIIASIAQYNLLIVLADLSFILFSRKLWRKWHHWTMPQRSVFSPGLPRFTGPMGSTTN